MTQWKIQTSKGRVRFDSVGEPIIEVPAKRTLEDFYVGVCPACSKPVPVDEPDGPVWTCPADLSPGNPFWEPFSERITEELRQSSGVFSNCGEDFGFPCYERLPLHSACYERGGY